MSHAGNGLASIDTQHMHAQIHVARTLIVYITEIKLHASGTALYVHRDTMYVPLDIPGYQGYRIVYMKKT